MWNEFGFLNDELQKVEEQLKKSVNTRNKKVKEIVSQFVLNGGKRMRPVLAISGATFGKFDSKTAVSVASCIELIHAATLIHDDIIDNSKLRRGQKTVHVELGADVAVFCGDFLLTKAFDMVAEIADIGLMKDLSRGLKCVCDSEIEQNLSRFNKNVSVYRYLKIIMGKTATLFALSLGVGGFMAGCDRTLCRTLGKIGLNIGMAFQIIDDVLDFEGEEKTVGKSLLNDALTGVYTLPVIYALNSEHKEELEEALEVLDKDGGSLLYYVVRKTNSLKRSRDLAKKYLDKAYNLTKNLEPAYGKQVIEFIIGKQLDRTY